MEQDIRRAVALPDGFHALVREAREGGFGALARMEQAWGEGTNRFDLPGEGLWSAHARVGLVGVCGLNVDPYLDDDRVARLRHLYVARSARRRGVGRALVSAALGVAAGRFERVRVRTTDPGAARFYAALGFEPARGADRATATHVLGIA